MGLGRGVSQLDQLLQSGDLPLPLLGPSPQPGVCGLDPLDLGLPRLDPRRQPLHHIGVVTVDGPLKLPLQARRRLFVLTRFRLVLACPPLPVEIPVALDDPAGLCEEGVISAKALVPFLQLAGLGFPAHSLRLSALASRRSRVVGPPASRFRFRIMELARRVSSPATKSSAAPPRSPSPIPAFSQVESTC